MLAARVNAAEAAIYGLSAAGLVLVIVAAWFVWTTLRARLREAAGRDKPTAAE